jgi:type III secretion protein I
MEIAALSNAVLAQVAPAPVARPDPASLATERFNALMGAPEAGETSALTGVQAALQSAFGPAPADASASLGGQILSGLRTAATEVSQKWQGIAGSLDQMGAHPPAISDMLRLQGQLLQVSVQYELVGKAVSRSTQNIDTLVRMS